MRHNNKKGVTLVYVVIVMAVLTVLSAAILTAASYNKNAADRSVQARQAYLNAKSVLEYARGYVEENLAELNKQAKPYQFYVVCRGEAADSGCDTALLPPDKLKTYAEVSLLDEGVSIKARAPYLSGENAQTLGFESAIQVTQPSYVPQDLNYMLCGATHVDTLAFSANGIRIFSPASSHPDFWEFLNKKLLPDGPNPGETAPFPLAVLKPLRLTSSSRVEKVLSGKLFFLGGGGTVPCLQAEAGAAKLTLKSDYFFFSGNVVTQAGVGPVLETAGGDRGIVCFDKNITVTVNNGASSPQYTIPAGFYSFPKETKIDFSGFSMPAGLERVKEEDLNADLEKEFKNEILFLKNNSDKMVSSVDINWTTSSGNNRNKTPQPGKIVYCATIGDGLQDTYAADQLLYQYGGSQALKVKNNTVIDVRYLWLNLADYDGSDHRITYDNPKPSLLLKNVERITLEAREGRPILVGERHLEGNYEIEQGRYVKKDGALDEVDLLAAPSDPNSFLNNYRRLADGEEPPGDWMGEGGASLEGGRYTNGT